MGRVRGKGTEDPKQALHWQADNSEPYVGLELTNCEIMNWAQVGCSTGWATQAPLTQNFWKHWSSFKKNTMPSILSFCLSSNFSSFWLCLLWLIILNHLMKVRRGQTNRNRLLCSFLSLGFFQKDTTVLLMGMLGPAQKILLWSIPHKWFSYFSLLSSYYVPGVG